MEFRRKPVVVEATQWFKNGDHPQDACEMVEVSTDGGATKEGFLSEGKVVRYYRRPEPEFGGEVVCKYCGKTLHVHGWIDTLEGGHIVCPGDWVVTGTKGERYPCKPDIFPTIYEPVGG